MIDLAFYTPKFNSALSYELSDEQGQFTALPNDWFDESRSDCYRVVILQDDTPIGFFVLDSGGDKYDYSDDDLALLLRSMSMNPDYQGKGYAKLALLQLQTFIKTHQMACNKIVLGVNHKNTPAQKLYEKSGFIKSDRTYMGKMGLQFIYELNM